MLERLPERLQRLARESFELLRTNPLHPSLHFMKVGDLWSARIGLSHRALAVEDGSDFIWPVITSTRAVLTCPWASFGVGYPLRFILDSCHTNSRLLISQIH